MDFMEYNSFPFDFFFGCITKFQYCVIEWLNSNVVGVSSIFYIGYRLNFCLLLNANEFKIVNFPWGKSCVREQNQQI
jgi:hypothetical protein